MFALKFGSLLFIVNEQLVGGQVDGVALKTVGLAAVTVSSDLLLLVPQVANTSYVPIFLGGTAFPALIVP